MPAVAAVPAWVAWVGVGLSAASTAAAAAGQRRAAKIQAETASQNARLSKVASKDAVKRGETEEQQHRTRVAQFIGAQKAALAASGVEIGSGNSSGSLLADTAALGEQDALTIRANARREAWGYRVQGLNYRRESLLAGTTGRFAAGSTLLTGLGNTASSIYGFGR